MTSTPTTPEREEADPLSAAKLLESIRWKAAEGDPVAQAKLIIASREPEINLAEEIVNVLREEGDAAITRFRAEIDRLRGKVPS